MLTEVLNENKTFEGLSLDENEIGDEGEIAIWEMESFKDGKITVHYW